MIAVKRSERDIIVSIINKYVPSCEILAFGSRISQKHRDSSDLDIAIIGKEKLKLSTMSRIKEELMESDIPYKVDILDYKAISHAFRSIIDKHNEKLVSS